MTNQRGLYPLQKGTECKDGIEITEHDHRELDYIPFNKGTKCKGRNRCIQGHPTRHYPLQ